MADLLIAVVSSLAVLGTLALAARAHGRQTAVAMLARLGRAGIRERAERQALLAGGARWLAATGPGSRLERYAVRRYPAAAFPDVMALCIGGLLGGALLGWVALGSVVLALACALAGPLLLDRVLVRWSGRRAQRVEQALPDALAVQSGALRAGHSLAGSLREVSAAAPAPLGPEVARAVLAVDLGAIVEVALEQMAGRTSSRDVELWVTAMLVHRRAGGNLAHILDGLAAQVRERARLRGEVRALTAQARLSGTIVGVAPLAFFLLLAMVSRREMRALFDTSLGVLVLGAGLAMQTCGFLWIRRILRLRT